MTAPTLPEAFVDEPPLIETKLVPPRLRRDALARRRLLAELDRQDSTTLTLVDAPAGFGKSVLVQSWCAHTDAAVAWLSLDQADNDPARLWSYLATSVDRIRPGLGRRALARLGSPGAAIALAVDDLINGVTAYGDRLAIVLDDLHVVTDEACLRTLDHAIAHLPAHGRVIATTRADPPLALGRLRGRGRLGEIRANGLAFTVDEAHQMLVASEGIRLDARSVELLVEKTEGWPAGLYLAALWLRGLADPAAGVRAFHGSHRHIADYLTSEVLESLDAGTRRFLLETSVLGRFNAALCDFALDRTDSSARLRELERTNGFLIPLDPDGEWFRYHHLFAELLTLELARTDPGAATGFHLRASDWCRRHGLTDEALDHAAAASDEELVATILSDEHLPLIRSGRIATVTGWVARLPDHALRERPDVPIAGALAIGGLGGSPRERKRLLSIAVVARDGAPHAWTPYHEVLLALASAPWVERDLGESVKMMRHAAGLARSAVPEGAVPALAVLAYLLFLAGDPAESRASAEEALARPEVRLRPHGWAIALSTLALLDAEQGAWQLAETAAREAVNVARDAGLTDHASAGIASIALGSALAGGGSLRRAEAAAVEGERLRRYPEPEAGHLHALLSLAAIRAQRGAFAPARSHLEEVERGLTVFDDAGRLPELASMVRALLREREASATPVADHLTPAELQVLELFRQELSLSEIAARLFVSRNTVKTHTRTLYRKLNVSSRDEAVVRATALGLLTPDDSPG